LTELQLVMDGQMTENKTVTWKWHIP